MKLTPDSSNNPNDPIDRLLRLIHQSWDGLIEAGKLCREQLELDPEWGEKVQERSKIITAQAVHRLAGIGLKYIAPLAISECPGAKKARSLPLEQQQKYTQEPLPLLIKSDNGWETLLVDLYNLTSDQANQVFASDHVRTESEQRAWIEDQNAKRVTQPVKENPPYRTVGSTLIVMSPCQFKRKELAKILAELE